LGTPIRRRGCRAGREVWWGLAFKFSRCEKKNSIFGAILCPKIWLSGGPTPAPIFGKGQGKALGKKKTHFGP